MAAHLQQGLTTVVHDRSICNCPSQSSSRRAAVLFCHCSNHRRSNGGRKKPLAAGTERDRIFLTTHRSDLGLACLNLARPLSHTAAERYCIGGVVDCAADFAVHPDNHGVCPKRIGRGGRNVLTPHTGERLV